MAVLLLPLGAIYFFRFYENELVRQTESELISQGSFIAALYTREIAPLLPESQPYGLALKTPAFNHDDYYTPIAALLDLASATILPPRQEAQVTNVKAAPAAVKAGEVVSDILKMTTRLTLSGTRVTDYKGIVVASSRGELGMSYAFTEEVRQALLGKYHSLIRKRLSDEPYPLLASISRGTGIRVHVTLPIIIHDRVVGTVMLSRSPRSILKSLHDRRYEAGLLAIILLLVAGGLAVFTSYTINRPIHALIHKARRITQGERNVDLTVDRRITREVVMLSDSIAAMAHTIEERAAYIKTFANAVSHEFKTPLTSMTATIELLQEHIETMSKKERDRFFTMIEQDTNRLGHLVQRLLELAQADILAPSGETTDIVDIISVLKHRYQNRGLDIRADISGRPVAIMAEEVFETIMTNLLDNSLQHGASIITITGTINHMSALLEIKDNGKGIDLSNLNKIFTPFFTTNREKGGTGLGLDIVKSLLDRHGGNIRVEPCDTGARFFLSLKILS